MTWTMQREKWGGGLVGMSWLKSDAHHKRQLMGVWGVAGMFMLILVPCPRRFSLAQEQHQRTGKSRGEAKVGLSFTVFSQCPEKRPKQIINFVGQLLWPIMQQTNDP